MSMLLHKRVGALVFYHVSTFHVFIVRHCVSWNVQRTSSSLPSVEVINFVGLGFRLVSQGLWQFKTTLCPVWIGCFICLLLVFVLFDIFFSVNWNSGFLTTSSASLVLHYCTNLLVFHLWVKTEHWFDIILPLWVLRFARLFTSLELS